MEERRILMLFDTIRRVIKTFDLEKRDAPADFC